MITDASVPDLLADAPSRTAVLDVARDQALLRVPGVARYLVTAGGPVRVAAESGATEADIACFRDGPVRALELLLDGMFALRAAAVRIGAGAVVICGPPASGKSALAAALALRGHPVLADKLAPVRLQPGPALLPTADAVELWPPMAEALGVLDRPSRVVRPALAKRAYRLGPAGADDPVPVSLIVLLGMDPRVTAPTVTEIARGVVRVRAVATFQAHRRLVPGLGRGLDHFEWLAALGEVQMIRLTRPRSGPTVAMLADLVEKAS